jgi:hypothetical protein
MGQQKRTSGRVRRPPAELRAQLQTQLDYLRRSCTAFDEGELNEAARLAVTLRVLFHDTGRSTSLLTLIGARDRLKISSQCEPFPFEGEPCGQSSLAFMSLRGLTGRWIPHAYDPAPRPTPRSMAIEDWWAEEVGWDETGHRFTRKDLVCTAANQDGGAHIDAEVDEHYYRLSRGNGLGWTMHWQGEPEGTPGVPFPDPVPVYIRQVAHDVLRTMAAYRTALGLEAFEIPTADMEDWEADFTPSPDGGDTYAQYHCLVTPSGAHSYIEASAYARQSGEGMVTVRTEPVLPEAS